jgi:hypothetical protein
MSAAKVSKMMLLMPDVVEAIVEEQTDDSVMRKALEGTLWMSCTDRHPKEGPHRIRQTIQ